MKIKLKQKDTLENLYSEEDLFDLSTTESIYVIRTLKALLESQDIGYLEVSKENSQGQVYSEKHDIWLSHYEKN